MPLSIRCGTDLIAVNRIEKAVKKLGQPFLDRIWTREEQAACMPDGRWIAASAASLAARFAAKEAAAKALGTGIGRSGIRWIDLAVQKEPSGRPWIKLGPPARTIYDQLGGQSISISLSHEHDSALAFCVLLHENGTNHAEYFVNTEELSNDQ